MKVGPGGRPGPPSRPRLVRGSVQLMGLLLAGCLRHAAPGPGGAVEFSLPELGSDVPYALASDRGKVIYLDVWATWCGPCRETLPGVPALEARFSGQGFAAYGVSVDEDPSRIGPFLRSLGLSLKVLSDPGGRVAGELLHVRVLPTAILLDREGRVRKVYEGTVGNDLERTASDIGALVSESHGPKQETL